MKSDLLWLGRLLVLLVLLLAAGGARAEQRTATLSRYQIQIDYDSSDQRVADRVSEICLEAIPVLASEIGLSDVTGFRIYLIQDMPAFKRAQGISLPVWGVAFALMESQVMLVDVDRATSAWNKLETVIPHELSHLLLAQRIGAGTAPVWFVEGLAMWQSRDWSLMDHWRLMESVWTQRMPTLGQMARALPADEAGARDAYRVAYVGFTERFDDRLDTLPAFLDEVRSRGEFAGAFASFFGETEIEYSARFAHELHSKYQSRLLLFQAGPLFSVIAFLFLFVYLRIHLRNRRRLRQMERVDRGLSMDDY